MDFHGQISLSDLEGSALDKQKNPTIDYAAA